MTKFNSHMLFFFFPISQFLALQGSEKQSIPKWVNAGRQSIQTEEPVTLMIPVKWNEWNYMDIREVQNMQLTVIRNV